MIFRKHLLQWTSTELHLKHLVLYPGAFKEQKIIDITRTKTAQPKTGHKAFIAVPNHDLFIYLFIYLFIGL